MLDHDGNGYAVLMLLTGLIVLAVIFNEMVTMEMAATRETMEAAEQWCNAMNGTLTFERVIGDGGLHCQTADGRLIKYTGQGQ